MDQLFWAAALFTIVIIGAIAGRSAYHEYLQKCAINKLYNEFVELIESEYKSRLSGSNRFLVNQDILKTVFPDAPMDEIEGVFKKLVETRIIDRDPIDNAWCLR